jgi:hypothetical protein
MRRFLIMIMKHVPNLITITRLFLIPIFIYAFFSGSPYGQLHALLIYLIAGVTDLLDGYLARKYNVVSLVGIVLDPLADKLMLLAALWCLFTVNDDSGSKHSPDNGCSATSCGCKVSSIYVIPPALFAKQKTRYDHFLPWLLRSLCSLRCPLLRRG